ncbi:toxin HicA [Mycobacterium sp. NPDC003449]
MASVAKIEAKMRESAANVDFSDLVKACEHYFGAPRQHKTSHAVFRTPWQGDPRVNIQNDHGKAKAYQVKQVLDAIAKINESRKENR